jgi:sec-independent protein translocase protein TatA
MGLSIWHVLIVLIIVLVLFGAGKLPRVMGDLAKGIKSFKEGLKDEPSPDPKSVSDGGAARSSESEPRNEAHKS